MFLVLISYSWSVSIFYSHWAKGKHPFDVAPRYLWSSLKTLETINCETNNSLWYIRHLSSRLVIQGLIGSNEAFFQFFSYLLIVSYVILTSARSVFITCSLHVNKMWFERSTSNLCCIIKTRVFFFELLTCSYLWHDY